jgi:hypothetical protein
MFLWKTKKAFRVTLLQALTIGCPTFSKENFFENTALLHKKILPGCGEYFKIWVKIPA